MSHRALARRALYVASLCALGFAGTVYAGGVSQPTVGSSNTVVADPTVPRPAGTPCVVELLNNESFADASNHPFNYAPPAGCQETYDLPPLSGIKKLTNAMLQFIYTI